MQPSSSFHPYTLMHLPFASFLRHLQSEKDIDGAHQYTLEQSTLLVDKEATGSCFEQSRSESGSLTFF